ncbi:MAG: hypothetical protein ACUVWZ_07375 [Anaerolineae bacterium]
METLLPDMIGTWVAVALTFIVFSYLLGDNVLYRWAEHLFVGAALGYAAVVTFHHILAPKLLIPLVQALDAQEGERLALLLVPLVLGLLLFTKSTKRFSAWGNLSLAFLVGVGGALAIGGALSGTLWPQIDATADVARYARYGSGLGLISGLVVLIGTTGVLLHFYFAAGEKGRWARFRNRIVQTWGGLGRWFLFIAFGAILATTFMSRLSLLTGRIQFLLDSARELLGG